MTLYSITAPNGVTYQTEGPPNATPEQIKRVILAAHPEAAVPKQEENALEKVPVVGGLLAGAVDLPLSFVSGLAGTGKTFTDVFGANNAASEFLDDVAKGAESWKSSGSKEDAAISAIDQKQAEGKGFWEEAKAAGRSFLRAPLETTASVTGSALPFIAAGLAAPETGGSSLIPIASMAGLGAISGTGMIKGDIYDAVYKAAIEHGASEEDAKAAADKAQEYGGENTDQIALGTAIGAAAAATGLPRQISAAIGRKAATEIIENTVAREVAEDVGRKSVLKGMAKGAIEESVPEGLQAAQERYAQNTAQRRQGYDVDQWAGVAGQGVFEGIASLIPGMAGGRAEVNAENRKAINEDIQKTFENLSPDASDEERTTHVDRFVARGLPEHIAQRVVDKIAAEKKALAEQTQQREEMRKAAMEQRTEGITPSPEPDINAPMPSMADELAPPPADPEEEAARQRFYGGEETMEMGAEDIPAPTPIQQTRSPNQPMTPEQAASTLDSDAAIQAFADQLGIDQEEAMNRLQEWSGIRYSRRGRPPKTTADDGLFGSLPTQEAPSDTAKREEFNDFRFAPEEQKAELLRQQQEQLDTAQERLTEKAARDEEARTETLGDIEYALRAQHPENAPYKVVYDPTDGKAPYKLVAERTLGEAKPEVVLSAPTLQDFSDAVYGQMDELTPYIPPAELSGQTVESADSTEPTVATSLIQQFTKEVDDARAAGQIDNNQRSELLGRLERPNSYVTMPNGTVKPNDAIAKLEAEAMQAMEAFRNADNAEARTAAEEKLNEVNGRLTAAVNNALLNPIRARMKSMIETRSDEKLGAKVREENAKLQEKLGSMEGENTAAERAEARDARIDRKEAEAPKRSTDRTDVSEEEIQRVNDNLEGKSAEDALEWLALNGPDRLYRAVANRVLATMRKLQGLGQVFELHIITPDSLRPDLEGSSNFAGVSIDSSYAYELHKPGSTEGRGVRKGTNDVWLRGPEFGELTGTTFSTALHEFIHAVTQRAIHMVQSGHIPASMPIARAVKDLEATFEAFKRHMDMVKDSTRPADMNDLEWSYFYGENNFGENIDEFIAWGLSDLDTQKYLMTIPYKKTGSLWTKLVDAMRKLFGIQEADGSLLAGLLEASEGLLSSPRSNFANVLGVGNMRMPSNIEEQLPLFNKPRAAKALADSDADVSAGVRRTEKSVNSHAIADGLGQAIKARDLDATITALRENVDGMKPATLRATLASLPTSGILNWFSDANIPSLKDIDSLIHQMSNMKMNIIKAADPIAKELDQFMLRDKEKVLAQTMSVSRINEYAPDSFKSLDEALQNEGIIKEIEKRVLKNANDKKLARQLLDELKALVEQKQSAKQRKGDLTTLSKPAMDILTKLQKDAIDATKTREHVEQLVERARQVRDGHMMWDKLAKVKGGQKLYKDIRAYYKDMFEAELALLDARIESLTDDKQAKRLRDLRADMMRAAISPEEAKKQGDMFYNIDPALFTKDYFPFMRQGKYWLRVKGDKQGTREREFYQFESAKERDRAIKKVAARLGVDAKDPNILVWGDDTADIQQKLGSEDLMMQQVFDLVGKTKTKMETEGALGSKDITELMDGIYQTWLMSTPERSVRRRFMHADEVVGFQQDLLRQFSSQVTSYANQLSKMAFAGDVRLAVKGAIENIADRPGDEQAKLRAVISEMEKRAEDEINPTPQNAVVNMMNRMSYFYYLTSAATAMVNLTSVPIRVLPRMWRDHGFNKSAAMYTKYMKLWSTLGNARMKTVKNGAIDELQAILPDLRGSKYINAKTARGELLRRAMKVGNDMNILETLNDTLVQNERETVQRHKTGATRAASNVLGGTAKALGVLFNTTENISRQAAYFMNFELAYDGYKAKNPQASEQEVFDHAIDVAVNAVRDTLGDYTSFERPRIAKGNLGRAVFLFKMYPVVQTKFMVGALRDIVRNQEPGARVGALKELTGVTMMAGLFGGMLGMPLYSLVALALSGSFFDEDDDDDVRRLMGLDVKVARDSDQMFRLWMADKFSAPTIGGVPLSDILVHGPIGALTDTELSSRTSLDVKNMWFREAVEGDSTAATILWTALANIAPGQMGVQAANSYDDFARGDIYSGLKKITPAFFRSFVAAAQGEDEGVVNRRGDTIVSPEDISTYDTIRSLLGFRSMRVARLQDYTITRAKNEKRINRERQALFNDFNRRRIEGEFDTPEKLREFWQNEVVPFNRTYPDPDFVITPEALQKSAKGRDQVGARTVQGMQLDKKTAARDLKMAKPFLLQK